MAEKLVTRLDAQDAGKTARARRASDRFARAVAEAELARRRAASRAHDSASVSAITRPILEAAAETRARRPETDSDGVIVAKRRLSRRSGSLRVLRTPKVHRFIDSNHLAPRWSAATIDI